jgi:hypothetical protein
LLGSSGANPRLHVTKKLIGQFVSRKSIWLIKKAKTVLDRSVGKGVELRPKYRKRLRPVFPAKISFTFVWGAVEAVDPVQF